MDAEPFPGLQITAGDFLDKQTERGSCPKCNKSRKYYCYTCFVPLKQFEGRVPKLKLPVRIDVIKHAREVEGKSTAAHAAVIAPDHVHIYTYPVIPDYPDADKVVLVFPGKEALTLQELKKRTEGSEQNVQEREKRGATCEPPAKKAKSDMQEADGGVPCPFERVVFIDSTWAQSKKIYLDERLQGLQQVVISEQETKFWRHQQGQPNTYLATIEAIYHFCREYHQLFLPSPYEGQYDDLLFFFLYMYNKIKVHHHGGHNLKAYKGRDRQLEAGQVAPVVVGNGSHSTKQCVTNTSDASQGKNESNTVEQTVEERLKTKAHSANDQT